MLSRILTIGLLVVALPCFVIILIERSKLKETGLFFYYPNRKMLAVMTMLLLYIALLITVKTNQW